MVMPRNAFAGIPALETRVDELLAEHTTFRVGGPADYFLVPESVEAIPAVIVRARDASIPLFVLAGGTNVLVADAGYRGAVLLLEKNLNEVTIGKTTIRAQAGARLPALAARAVRHGLAGLEPLAGVPGAVGGALTMNAGAFGAEFGSLVRRVHGFTLAGEPRSFDRAEIHYAYRTAIYPDRLVFTGVELELREEDAVAIGRRAAEIRAKRSASQPTRSHSAGCAFQNPPGGSAGRTIDTAGLKGLRVGGAVVSDVHANYLINTGSATAEDIRRLIALVQERVQAIAGVHLEAEVRMLGFQP
jgi:UDP-N-acetylmuramate dehydrogenase